MGTFIPQGPDGSTAPANTVPVGGKDGSGNLQTVHTDTDGDIQVDVVSSVLPTGAATEGTVGSVADNTQKLADCIDSDGTPAPALVLQVAGNTKGGSPLLIPVHVDISGDVQVDLASALPAGTNAIGKLAANSGVDIGDVDVTSILPGVGATNLGKAEDAAHVSGDTGVMSLAVRNNGLASFTNNDGDYSPIAVNLSGAVAVAGFDSDSESLIPLLVDSTGALQTVVGVITLDSDPGTSLGTFTGTGNGSPFSSQFYLYYSLSVTGTGGTATLWDVRLEASIDSVNWTQLLAHTNADGNGTIVFLSTPRAIGSIRARVAGLTLGPATNIIVRVARHQ